jgi:hypothetical protein
MSMTAKMTIEIDPSTAEVSIGPHPKASLAAGAKPVSILMRRKVKVSRETEYNSQHRTHQCVQLKVGIKTKD